MDESVCAKKQCLIFFDSSEEEKSNFRGDSKFYWDALQKDFDLTFVNSNDEFIQSFEHGDFSAVILGVRYKDGFGDYPPERAGIGLVKFIRKTLKMMVPIITITKVAEREAQRELVLLSLELDNAPYSLFEVPADEKEVLDVLKRFIKTNTKRCLIFNPTSDSFCDISFCFEDSRVIYTNFSCTYVNNLGVFFQLLSSGTFNVVAFGVRMESPFGEFPPYYAGIGLLEHIRKTLKNKIPIIIFGNELLVDGSTFPSEKLISYVVEQDNLVYIKDCYKYGKEYEKALFDALTKFTSQKK